jgi:hypothetical protein
MSTMPMPMNPVGDLNMAKPMPMPMPMPTPGGPYGGFNPAPAAGPNMAKPMPMPISVGPYGGFNPAPPTAAGPNMAKPMPMPISVGPYGGINPQATRPMPVGNKPLSLPQIRPQQRGLQIAGNPNAQPVMRGRGLMR